LDFEIFATLGAKLARTGWKQETHQQICMDQRKSPADEQRRQPARARRK